MGSPGSQTEEPQRESMYYYMGLFMSCAYTWHKQSKAKIAQASAFQALEKEVASLKEGKERLAAHWAASRGCIQRVTEGGAEGEGGGQQKAARGGSSPGRVMDIQ